MKKATRTKGLIPLDTKHTADLRHHMDRVLFARTHLGIKPTDRTKIRFTCTEELLLQKGHTFTHVSPRLPRGVPRGMPKYCFANAGDIAMGRDDLFYCEGYAAGIIPVQHAWLCDREGVIYERTWDKPATAYIGMVFDVKYLLEIRANPKTSIVCLLDQYPLGYPLLTGEHDIDTVSFKPWETACSR